MKRDLNPLLVLAVAMLPLAGLHASAAEPAAACRITDLTWIAGSWELQKGPVRIEEHWMCPTEDSLVGMGRTSAKGRTKLFEFLRIEERPDGIFYVAQPKGAAPTSFKLVRCDRTSAVFENPAHDFPKRVIYRKGEDGSLLARVEGDAGSPEKAEDFPYRRASSACK